MHDLRHYGYYCSFTSVFSLCCQNNVSVVVSRVSGSCPFTLE